MSYGGCAVEWPDYGVISSTVSRFLKFAIGGNNAWHSTCSTGDMILSRVVNQPEELSFRMPGLRTVDDLLLWVQCASCISVRRDCRYSRNSARDGIKKPPAFCLYSWVSPSYLAALLFLLASTTSHAQILIEEQTRMDFGTLAVTANTTVSRFTYPRTGNNINIQGQFILISSGSPGRYRFSGFPANTTLTISLNNTSLAAVGVGISEQLFVDNYDIGTVATNADGEAEMELGARLSTTGNGGSYADVEFSGNTVLRVEYWQPDVSAFVFNTQVVEVDAALRSTLIINEEQALNFGTLFARSSTTEQAVMNLSPTGSYTIDEAGDTRLVSLVSPDQAVLRVSGAAPNYSLSITPQTSDVLLQHTQIPGSSPHFILSNLVTSPDNLGVADENGELLITLGGTLKTELTAFPTIYPSGQYEGTYQFTVTY